jgi:hypothetical protein
MSKVVDSYSVSVSLFEIGKTYLTQYKEIKFEELTKISSNLGSIKNKKFSQPYEIVWNVITVEERCTDIRAGKLEHDLRIKERNLIKNTRVKQNTEAR